MSILNPALIKLLQIKNTISFFNDLTDEEISDLIFNIRFQRFDANEVLFKEGDTNINEIYYLISGSIDLFLFSKKTKKDVVLSTIDKPILFGEMSYFTQEPREVTAKSKDQGAILITFLIKESNEVQDPSAFSKFYKNVIKKLSKIIIKMNTKAN